MSGYEEWISIIPLINFDSFVQSIKLDDGVCLRRISNDELKKLKDAFPGSRKMLMLALTDVNHVLEINTLTLDGEFVIFDHKQPRVQNVIRALRLLKSGDVTVSCSFLLDENKEASALAWPSSSIVSENRYLLKQEEINRLLELLKKLQKYRE